MAFVLRSGRWGGRLAREAQLTRRVGAVSMPKRIMHVLAVEGRGTEYRQQSATLRIRSHGSSLDLRGVVVRNFASYPAHQVVGLPALSPTMEKGNIASWEKKEGETFGAGDVLAEVETDKAVVAFEAQEEGVIAKILVPAGTNDVKVGQPIVVIVEDAKDVGAFADFKPEGAGAPAPAPAPASKPPAPAPAPSPAPSAAPSAPAPSPGPHREPGGRVAASPLAKTLAHEKGLDLSQVVGTGPNGRIIAADVREFVPSVTHAEAPAAQTPTAGAPQPAPAAAAAAAAPSPVPGIGYTDYPLSDSAKAIAAKLTMAKQTVPHYYLTVDVVLDKVLDIRSRLNADLDEGEKLSVYDFLLKAAALASKKVPDANASWHGDFVRHYHSVDVNVMVGVGDGLVAPVVRGVDVKGLRVISRELHELQKGAQDGSIKPDALQTGTITVVNVGMYGVKSVAPIVSLPQAVVLGVGAIENRVYPKEGGKKGEEEGDVYEVKTAATVTLSCDHRVIDGAVGAQWLSVFKGFVEEPTTLLL